MKADAAFLADILEHPADDTPRLTYADWLEDQGQCDYASFIRVQCELARVCNEAVCRQTCTPPDFEGCPQRDLRRRERKLLKAHIGTWTNSLPEPLVTQQCPSCVDQAPDWETNVVECRRCESTGLIPDHDGIEFHRGFIAGITCRWTDWKQHGPALVKQHPLERVTIRDLEPRESVAFPGSWVLRSAPAGSWADPEMMSFIMASQVIRHDSEKALLDMISRYMLHLAKHWSTQLAPGPKLSEADLQDIARWPYAAASGAAVPQGVMTVPQQPRRRRKGQQLPVPWPKRIPRREP